MHALRYFALAFALSGISLAVPAGEMRSVSAEWAILYDAPSLKAKRLFMVPRFTPVEVIVTLNILSKVRDAEGTIAWIDKALLSDQRMVVVTTQAEIRQSPSHEAPSLATADKGLALELLELPNLGWVKIRHRDGITGFIRQNQAWGI